MGLNHYNFTGWAGLQAVPMAQIPSAFDLNTIWFFVFKEALGHYSGDSDKRFDLKGQLCFFLLLGDEPQRSGRSVHATDGRISNDSK